MPTADPIQYLMDALAILTRGLITDLQSLFLGMLVCTFLLIALDLLKDALLVPLGNATTEFLTDPVGNYHRAKARMTLSSAPGAPIGHREIELSPEQMAELGAAPLLPVPASQESREIELSAEDHATLEDAYNNARRNER